MAAKKKGRIVTKFGSDVQGAREKADLTRAQLAARVGCGNSAIRSIEEGLRCPSLDMAARIAVAVGMAKAKLSDYARGTA